MTKEDRSRLFTDYCMELSQYDENPEGSIDENIRQTFEKYISNPDAYHWTDIEICRNPVGFLICMPNNDNEQEPLRIIDAYVEKEFRHKYCMTNALHIIMKTYAPSIIALSIFENNNVAKKFWSDWFDRHGFKQIIKEGPDAAGLCSYIYKNYEADDKYGTLINAEDPDTDDDAEYDRQMNMLLWNLLKDHFGHKVEIAVYGDIDNPASVTLEDTDTNEIILDAELYTICAREDI